MPSCFKQASLLLAIHNKWSSASCIALGAFKLFQPLRNAFCKIVKLTVPWGLDCSRGAAQHWHWYCSWIGWSFGTPIFLYKKLGFPRQTLPFSYVEEARAKTGSVFLCPLSYFWWVLYSSGSGFLCPFLTPWLRKGQFSVRCLPKAACRSVTPWLKKSNFHGFQQGSFFGEVFAEGSLPERHTLVLEKR